MAFGMSKLSTRRRDLSVLPDDWVACLEPGVEVEGNLKAASGCIRLNTRIKGDIVSEGAVVIREQCLVTGQSRAHEGSSDDGVGETFGVIGLIDEAAL